MSTLLKAYQKGLMACQEAQRGTEVHMDGISPHSTGLCPLSGPLPKKINIEGMDMKIIVEQMAMKINVEQMAPAFHPK